MRSFQDYEPPWGQGAWNADCRRVPVAHCRGDLYPERPASLLEHAFRQRLLAPLHNPRARLGLEPGQAELTLAYPPSLKHRLHSQSLLGIWPPGGQLSLVRRAIGRAGLTVVQPALHLKETTMKKLVIAVALIVASAAPALAQDFAQSYSDYR